MLDRANAADVTAAIDQPAAKAPRRVNLWRLAAIGLLAFVVATLGGRFAQSGGLWAVREAPSRPAAGQTSTAPDVATAAAIKDLIRRANDAQVKAFAQRDVTLMRSTATDGYYQELVQIDAGLARSGVTKIDLTKLDFGAVTLSGDTASATTYETWLSTYSDGSVDERTDRNDYTLVRENGEWRIDSDVQPEARLVNPSTTVSGVQPGAPASVSSASSNWSGYVASGGTFTSVTGTWTVPNVSWTIPGSDATWVGIGGLTTRDLIQAGTQATVTGDRSVSYEAWIEMLPQTSRTIPLSVSAGDSVTVSLTNTTGTDWAIRVRNNTTGETYNVTVQYASSKSSAEWIQEAPSAGRGIVPLDDFGTLAFAKGGAVRDGKTMSLRDLGARPVAMINGRGEVLAQPSSLGTDGAGFTVTRTRASSTIRGTPYRGRGAP